MWLGQWGSSAELGLVNASTESCWVGWSCRFRMTSPGQPISVPHGLSSSSRLAQGCSRGSWASFQEHEWKTESQTPNWHVENSDALYWPKQAVGPAQIQGEEKWSPPLNEKSHCRRCGFREGWRTVAILAIYFTWSEGMACAKLSAIPRTEKAKGLLRKGMTRVRRGQFMKVLQCMQPSEIERFFLIQRKNKNWIKKYFSLADYMGNPRQVQNKYNASFEHKHLK